MVFVWLSCDALSGLVLEASPAARVGPKQEYEQGDRREARFVQFVGKENFPWKFMRKLLFPDCFFWGIIPCVSCEELPLWIWDAVLAVEAFCVSGRWHIDACRTRRLVGGKNKRESTWERLYCLTLLPFSSAWDSGCFLLSNQDNRWLNKLTP